MKGVGIVIFGRILVLLLLNKVGIRFNDSGGEN